MDFMVLGNGYVLICVGIMCGDIILAFRGKRLAANSANTGILWSDNIQRRRIACIVCVPVAGVILTTAIFSFSFV